MNIDIMKKNKLKSVIKLFVLSLVLILGVASCSYDDFVENEFDFTSVYFPKETIDRSFIMGEDMQIGVGIVLGGRLSNTEDVEVTFSLNDTVVTNAGKTILPTSHYQLLNSDGNPANNKIIIPAGKTQGFVYVKADSLNLLSDALSLGNNYSLGFQLDNVVKADSILSNIEGIENKGKITRINFSYINQLYGFYVQKGQYTRTPLVDDPTTTQDETTVVETITYPGGINDVLELTMVDPTTLVTSGIANLQTTTTRLNLSLNRDDNTLSISQADGGIAITDDGGSSYNPETREIILNYSFEFDNFTYKATDVLDFRNRIVDGVNQFDI